MPTSIELTPMMMREIIMDHYQNPRHKGKPADPSAYLSLHASSTNCIDDFDVYLAEKNGQVADAKWEGVACTISSASTDILCDRVIGLSSKDAEYTITQYLNMIEEKLYDASVLDEAIVFMNTGKQAARIHCATMGWTAMKELLEQEEKK
jgi:nitrogen fixation protein NifU and related proteins